MSRCVQCSKRQLLLGGIASWQILTLTPPSHASLKRSLKSETSSTLTFNNQTDHNVKVYWNNYDADKELFATLAPQSEYTVDTFVSHPWTVVDAESGDILSEYVASEGMHLVQINDKENGKSNSAEDKGKKIARVLDERLDMSGFDGLGASQDSYANAELFQIGMDFENGLAALKVEGFEEPVTLVIGIPEAAAMLYAAGLESRRPSTLRTWQQCINALDAKVERILITRIVGHTYYSRIILNHSGKTVSLDSRPSDSLALALQSRSPVFVAKDIARFRMRPPTSLRDEENLNQILLPPDSVEDEPYETI